MNNRLLLALLGLPEGVPTSEESFMEARGFSAGKTQVSLEEASRLGLVMNREGYLRVSPAQRLSLAVRCLENGIDIESVCRVGGWKEFEDVAAMILDNRDYVTKKHLRFRSDNRGYEVDLLASGRPWSLVVECKRWKKSRQPGVLKKIARTQSKKASLLGAVWPGLWPRLDRRVGRTVKLVPVVLTLSDTYMEIEEGVPIVSINRFQTFVDEFSGYISDLQVFTGSST